VILRLLDEARNEMREAARWYEDKRLGLGDDFLSAVESGFETIAKRPRSFTRMINHNEGREVRRCVLKRFPYLIVFEIRSEELFVVAVAHSKRKPKYCQDRLL